MVSAPFQCGTSSNTTNTSEKTGKQSAAAEKSAEGDDSPNAATTLPSEPLVPPIRLDGGDSAEDDELTAADFRDFDFRSGDRAIFHAHGEQVCASGCAASRHPTATLSKAKYLWLLRRFVEQPLDETSPALESLMYFGRQTLLWMEKLGTEPLDENRTALLKRELRKTHALVRFRVVDEHGVVRVHIPPTRVPLDRRHVFRMETKDLPPLITSGTVKRVGLHHLWTRL